MHDSDLITSEIYKPYRYSLALTSQFYFCGIPFRLDTAPKCALNCLYCFAMTRGGRRTSKNLLASPAKIARKLKRSLNEHESETDIVDSFLQKRMPVHFGGMSDPFATSDVTFVSCQMLDILGEYDYPVVLSTKNTKVMVQDSTLRHFEKLKHLIVQVSFSLSDQISRKIEPCVPPPRERLKAIKALTSEGIYVIARLQPLFPHKFDEIVQDLIPSLSEVGVQHVVVEFLKLPVESNISLVKHLFKNLGWDGYSFYRDKGALRVGREWILPLQYRWESLQPVIKQIRAYGMTYGAGDYGLNHLGDTDCCCGIDRVPGFSNWFHGNIAFYLRNNRTNVIIFDQSAFESLPDRPVGMYINSHSRIHNHNTLFEYLRLKWNQPGTANAPDSYFGISWKGDIDENGNCVYYREGSI